MTHITRRLTAKNRDQPRAVIEYGLPLLYTFYHNICVTRELSWTELQGCNKSTQLDDASRRFDWLKGGRVVLSEFWTHFGLWQCSCSHCSWTGVQLSLSCAVIVNKPLSPNVAIQYSSRLYNYQLTTLYKGLRAIQLSCRPAVRPPTSLSFPVIIFISPRTVAYNIIVQKKNNLTKRKKHRKD